MAKRYSISELQQRTHAIVDEAAACKEPVYIAKGDRASVLLIDADTYLNDMQALHEFKRIYDTERSIRPKVSAQTPKPADETVSEANETTDTGKRYAWRCTICGYIEYADELPDDYKCPICSMGKEVFERIEI